MPVSNDIVEAYRRPRRVMARHLAAGVREDRALIFLMGACVLMFIAQWPGISRAAHLDPSIPLDARMGTALMGAVIIAPLVFYGIAAVLHLITRVLKGKGTWYTSRLALFWTLLVLSPLTLLHGLTEGFMGPSPALMLVKLIGVAAFFWIWCSSLWEAEKGQ